jgi:hypothetical protein
MKNHVWIVEILDCGEWLPCEFMGITKKRAMDRKREFFSAFPYDKFRIVKYEAVSK